MKEDWRLVVPKAQCGDREAFVQVYLDLPRLRDPDAFPVWLRRIVFKYCDRATHRSRLPTRPFDPETDSSHGTGSAEERRKDTAEDALHGAEAASRRASG
jgi:hypothetical protein